MQWGAYAEVARPIRSAPGTQRQVGLCRTSCTWLAVETSRLRSCSKPPARAFQRSIACRIVSRGVARQPASQRAIMVVFESRFPSVYSLQQLELDSSGTAALGKPSDPQASHLPRPTHSTGCCCHGVGPKCVGCTLWRSAGQPVSECLVKAEAFHRSGLGSWSQRGVRISQLQNPARSSEPDSPTAVPGPGHSRDGQVAAQDPVWRPAAAAQAPLPVSTA